MRMRGLLFIFSALYLLHYNDRNFPKKPMTMGDLGLLSILLAITGIVGYILLVH